jgi:hypothetical protein
MMAGDVFFHNFVIVIFKSCHDPFPKPLIMV